MKIDYTYQDTQLGTVCVTYRPGMRNIIMRVRTEGILVSASPRESLSRIKQVVHLHASSLLAKQAQCPARPFYDLSFKIETDVFQLRFEEQESAHFQLRSEPGRETIYCPLHTDFQKEGIQEWLHKVICEALRAQASLYLPSRLRTLSLRCGLPFTKVCIRASKTRWGSCSSQKHISLSFFLMTLPSRLIDAVLIHELCHTKEMNHGPRFWALMDTYTEGKAAELTAELKQYRTIV